MITSLAENAYEIGLQINTKKTKIMTNDASQSPHVHLFGETLEQVKSFCYLGSMIDDKDADIDSRISKENRAFGMLNRVWHSSDISINTKLN